ncbi:hypothetical protein SDC9_202162 [bioreactor metagenome]|uniref:Uncharacterized protein n=1 Tax=bioreactor metagenome TaxID=1076179 RepID=A0A645IUH2_9ZZZZ
MTNYTKYEILNGIIKLITSVGTMIVLGKRYIWAVAFSLTISEVVVNILKTIQVKMKVGILPYEIKNFIYVIFIALVEFLLISSISKIQNFLIWVITMSITVILSYIITFNLSPDKDDREFIKTIVKKINNIF